MAELFVADPGLALPGAEIRLPRFSLVVSMEANRGWHRAALVRDVASPAFYLRSIAAPWPFVLARPYPSTRQRRVMLPPEQMSPAATSPMSKLVVNWNWERGANATEELRFFVKRRGPVWLWSRQKLSVRLRLKQQASPQRRYLVRVASGPIDWREWRAVELVPGPSSSPVRG